MQFWAVECSLNRKYSGLDGVDSGSYFGPGIALNAVPTGFKCSSLQVGSANDYTPERPFTLGAGFYQPGGGNEGGNGGGGAELMIAPPMIAPKASPAITGPAEPQPQHPPWFR